MSIAGTSQSEKPQVSRLVAFLVLAAIAALVAATPFLPN